MTVLYYVRVITILATKHQVHMYTYKYVREKLAEHNIQRDLPRVCHW